MWHQGGTPCACKETFPETTFYNGDTNNSFIIHSDDLIEIKNTGIKGLIITINKLNENDL